MKIFHNYDICKALNLKLNDPTICLPEMLTQNIAADIFTFIGEVDFEYNGNNSRLFKATYHTISKQIEDNIMKFESSIAYSFKMVFYYE